MKKLLLSAAVLFMFSGTYVRAGAKGNDKKKTALKEHVCTAACKDGKHVYAHGEKGHVCTDACKKKS